MTTDTRTRTEAEQEELDKLAQKTDEAVATIKKSGEAAAPAELQTERAKARHARHLRFIRLAESRLNRVMADMHLIENLASANYFHTKEEAVYIVETLGNAVKAIGEKLAPPPPEDVIPTPESFRLPTHEKYAAELDTPAKAPVAMKERADGLRAAVTAAEAESDQRDEEAEG